MNPLLTDDAVARLPLHDARSALVEEIVRTPVAGERPLAAVRASGARHRAWLVPVAVAAAVALLAAGTAWWANRPDGRSAPPPVASTAPVGDGYQAVLDAEGWTMTNVYRDDAAGEIGYAAGPASVKISWYPARLYRQRLDSRRHLTDPPSDGTAVDIAGRTGVMWDYAADDHTALRPVEAGHFLEVRGSGMDQQAYVELLGRLRMVDAAQLDAALPPGFVRDDQRGSQIQQILDGIALYADPLLPAGHDRSEVTSDQSDPYQLGSDVAGRVACDWVAEYDAARRAGDQARAQRAVDVMATSRQWPVLREIADQGDTPEWIWAMADQMAAGQVPPGYLPSCRGMGALP